jgi:hypothetical protein
MEVGVSPSMVLNQILFWILHDLSPSGLPLSPLAVLPCVMLYRCCAPRCHAVLALVPHA